MRSESGSLSFSNSISDSWICCKNELNVDSVWRHLFSVARWAASCWRNSSIHSSEDCGLFLFAIEMTWTEFYQHWLNRWFMMSLVHLIDCDFATNLFRLFTAMSLKTKFKASRYASNWLTFQIYCWISMTWIIKNHLGCSTAAPPSALVSKFSPRATRLWATTTTILQTSCITLGLTAIFDTAGETYQHHCHPWNLVAGHLIDSNEKPNKSTKRI